MAGVTTVEITAQVPGHAPVPVVNTCDTREAAERWAAWRVRHLKDDGLDVLDVTVKTALRLVALAVLAALAACSNPDYDPDMCDFYQSLGAGYEASQGYVPADTQAQTDKFCER